MPHVITTGGGVAATKDPKDVAKIIIKQTVKQTVNERKRRKKASQQTDKRSAANKRNNGSNCVKSLYVIAIAKGKKLQVHTGVEV